MKVEQAAEIAYEANRIHQQQLGNYNLPKWCEADDSVRSNAIQGVRDTLSSKSIQSFEENYVFFGTIGGLSEHITA